MAGRQQAQSLYGLGCHDLEGERMSQSTSRKSSPRVMVIAAAVAGALVLGGTHASLFAGSTLAGQLFKPIGSVAAGGSGDYISTSSGGIGGTYFTYFIEVPPNQSQLVVDIFDADVGIGGDADRTGNRDWDYAGNGFTGTVNYSLFQPNGTQVTTSFNQGSSTGPTGSDNAWLTLYDSSSTTTTAPAFVGVQTNVQTGGHGLTVTDPLRVERRLPGGDDHRGWQ